MTPETRAALSRGNRLHANLGVCLAHTIALPAAKLSTWENDELTG